jgi:hypothetical protein
MIHGKARVFMQDLCYEFFNCSQAQGLQLQIGMLSLSISIKRGEGMVHWGWYWKVKKKHIKRVICSTLARIDYFALYKEGVKTYSSGGFTVDPIQD